MDLLLLDDSYVSRRSSRRRTADQLKNLKCPDDCGEPTTHRPAPQILV